VSIVNRGVEPYPCLGRRSVTAIMLRQPLNRFGQGSAGCLGGVAVGEDGSNSEVVFDPSVRIGLTDSDNCDLSPAHPSLGAVLGVGASSRMKWAAFRSSEALAPSEWRKAAASRTSFSTPVSRMYP